MSTETTPVSQTPPPRDAHARPRGTRFPIGLVSVTAAMLVLSAAPLRADDDDATREQRSAQLIFNAMKMSNEAGWPIPPLVRQYRLAGTTSSGVGYRGQHVGREDGKNFVCLPGVTYLNEKGLALTLDQTAAQLGAERIGSDRRMGATIYVQRDDRGDADRILFLMRQGNVQPLLPKCTWTDRFRRNCWRPSVRRANHWPMPRNAWQTSIGVSMRFAENKTWTSTSRRLRSSCLSSFPSWISCRSRSMHFGSVCRKRGSDSITCKAG